MTDPCVGATRPAAAITRRGLISASAALPMVAVLRRQAAAAEFTLRFANGQEPSHPVNVRAAEAIKRIADKTAGAVAIRQFPNAQLGADPDLLAQLRAGGVDLINMGSDVLTTLVPVEAILNLGYAFTSYDQVWKAMDGSLGSYLAQQIAGVGLRQIGRSWDNGFRQITTTPHPITDPASLRGFKIRVPPAPMLTSLFRGLGASPTPVNFNELYSALQTHLVDGEENALPIIATAKLYEVQKYLSLTNHSWSAYLILANTARMKRLPQKYQDIIVQEFDQSAIAERADIQHLGSTLAAELKGKGMTVNTTVPGPFRTILVQSGYYKEWRGRFGEKAWSSLESAVGPLG